MYFVAMDNTWWTDGFLGKKHEGKTEQDTES